MILGEILIKYGNYLRGLNISFIGKYLFLIGIVFLPSALPISLLFLLSALIISIRSIYKEFFLDKINILLITLSTLMIASNFRYLFSSPEDFLPENLSNTWIDLFNWIPLFICFWGFQSYLKTESDRKLLANSLLIGTFPVLISCILQFWFGMYGPYSAFNGLIIWFQREPGLSSVTGLFNNPNYAGFWLTSIWPFSAYSVLNKKNNIVLLIYFIFISYFLILTNSRNALIGLLMSLPILFGLKVFISFLVISLILLGLFFGFTNLFELEVEIYKNLIPINLINKLTNLDLGSLKNIIRIDGFKKALYFIKLRPIWGWGASLFPILYLASGGIRDTQHTHNINLEVALNYGIPSSILLTFIVSIIFIKSLRIIFFKKNNNSLINKAWFASMLVVIIYNTTDIPYYDGKFSLLSWILLGGLKCIIDQQKNKKILKKID